MLQFKYRSRLAALAAVCVFIVYSAQAAQTVSSRPGLRALSPSQRFVWNAAETDMAEIGIGRLAVQNSQNPAIQDFGHMLMRDHSQNLKELQNIAENNSFRMPTALDRKHQMLFNKLSSLSGAQFDQQFAAEMVRGHQQAVRMFENASRSRITPQLRDFAKNSLPTLRNHLNTAEKLQSSATARTRGTTAAPGEPGAAQPGTPSETARPSQPVQTLPGSRSEEPTNVSAPHTKPAK